MPFPASRTWSIKLAWIGKASLNPACALIVKKHNSFRKETVGKLKVRLTFLS